MKAVYKDLNVDDKFLPIKAAINFLMSRWKDRRCLPQQALHFFRPVRKKDAKGAI